MQDKQDRTGCCKTSTSMNVSARNLKNRVVDPDLNPDLYWIRIRSVPIHWVTETGSGSLPTQNTDPDPGVQYCLIFKLKKSHFLTEIPIFK